MKKHFTLSFFIIIAATTFAQLPVSQTVQKKKVLIEDFTGNSCPGCPAGNEAADILTASNPSKVFSMCVHGNYFGIPYTSPTSLEFRVPDGLVLENITPGGVATFPSAYINRKTFHPSSSPSQGIAIPVSHPVGSPTSSWAQATNAQLSQDAYVNIAGEAFLNPTTRQLLINIEAYYTGNSPVATNKISVALLQDSIIAYQKFGYMYPAMYVAPNEDYIHNHALRDMITSPATGETMSGANTMGTTFNKTINYTVAATYPSAGTKTIPAVLNKLRLLAWVSEADTAIINVCKIPITITTSSDIFNTGETTEAVSIYPNPSSDNATINFTLQESNSVSVNILNTLGQTVLTNNLGILNAGKQNYNLDIATLSKGIYVVNFTIGNKTISKKISVIK